MKKKDLLPKDLWEKKRGGGGEGEEERSTTKWFVRKEKEDMEISDMWTFK